MAAPIFQQEGNLTAVTTGNLTVTIPAVEQADDILVVTTVAWVPNTGTGANTIAAPTGWTKFTPAVTTITGGLIDAEYAFFWKRAVGGDADPVFTRPTGWDTGTDTVWAGRCYVIRGCITTGDPWDTITNTAISTAANPAFPAITVSGTERLVVVFAVKTDNSSLPTAATGYTTELQLTTTTGTDAAVNSYTIDSTNSSASAVTPTGGAAPAQGGTVYFGVSFKSPAVVTTDRTASGSGASSESATGSFFSVLDVTATGSGTGTESATGVFATPIGRTADGSGAGAGTADWVKFKTVTRTATADGSADLIDGFTAYNRLIYGSGSNTSVYNSVGVTFTGNGSTIASAQFGAYASSALSDVYVSIYAHTGTFGTSGTPTGSALATSNVRSLGTTNVGFVSFEFSGANKIVLQNGVNYCLVISTATTGQTLWLNESGGFFLDDGNYFYGSNTTLTWTAGSKTTRGFKVIRANTVNFVTKTKTATGSGTGTESATGQILLTVNRTATGSGSSTQSTSELRTVPRTATGSGTSSDTADDQLTHFETATGSGTGTSIAHIAVGRFRTGSGTAFGTTGGAVTFFVTRIRTATGSATGSQTAAFISTPRRTATGSGLGSQTAARVRTVLRFASGVGYSDSTADDQLTHFRTATGSGSSAAIADWDSFRARNATGSGTSTQSATVSVVQVKLGGLTDFSFPYRFGGRFYVGVFTITKTATGSGTSTQSAIRKVTRLRTATGSGVGSQSATRLVTFKRTVTAAAGTGSSTASRVITRLRTASASGLGTSSSVCLRTVIKTSSGSGLGTSSGIAFVTRKRTAAGSGFGDSVSFSGVLYVRTATGTSTTNSSALWVKSLIFRPPFDGEFRWADYGATDSTSMFFGRMRPGQKASNIYKMVDGSYTTIASRDYSTVSKVYHGGHENFVTAEEKADLIAAGYGDYVT